PNVEKPSSSPPKVPPEVLTDAEIKDFITKDNFATAKKMVERTENFGRFLSQGEKKEPVSTSQIRDVYGTVKKLEVAPWDKVKTPRQLLLLKPRLEYAAARHKGRMGHLKKVINSAIDCVGEDEANFKRFCQFFEAIVAYQVAEQKK
ncbi:MAG: type III-A CRISPR-associated protein Csm2, partial [Thiotrichaceae bacterium IS1]